MEESLYYIASNNNWHGIPTPDLVCQLQYYQELFQMGGPDIRGYFEGRVDSIVAELKRRQKMQSQGIVNTNPLVIQTIKEKLGGHGLADIIGRYTEVFVHKKQWTFRCTLHGEDRHPSGVIYPDEMKWHCFACGKHGDCFDAVMSFERVPLMQAIHILGRYLGIDTKPNRKVVTGGIKV